jgi:hypothetical protein
MVNKHLGYNTETGSGNPTKSPAVNELIKNVKKHEVRGEAVPSNARREFTLEEFRKIIHIAQHDDTFNMSVRLPTIYKLQLHLIARVDDTVHIMASELKIHSQFEFALRIRLRWTKNCLEERDAPEQILLGSQDSDFCVLVALGIYIVHSLEYSNYIHSNLLFCDTDETVATVKTQVGMLLRTKVVKHAEFASLLNQNEGSSGDNKKQLVGSHSLRKLASTLARLMGRTQDEMDHRGRWRNTKRVSDRYTATTLPVIDAVVASSLCIGGPVKYGIKEDSIINDNWLLSVFVPNIAVKYGNRVALTLGKALLWAVVDPAARKNIPLNLYTLMTGRYSSIKISDENPIEKRALVVYSVAGVLMIDESGGGDGRNNNIMNNNSNLHAHSGDYNEASGAVIAQNQAIRIQNAEILNTLRQQQETLMSELNRIKMTIRRFANRPAQAVGGFFAPKQRNQQQQDTCDHQQHSTDENNTATAPDNVPFATTLSSQPRSLFELWEEYEFGLGGRKAAKRFSTRERGRVRYKYHRRKVVWDKVQEMIRRGHTYHTAIDELYQKYGEQSTVTEIINRMRRDRMSNRQGV